ncbi:MAG: dockerin type I repeat-containing protein [Ruminococcus sp.]|nr:dockerin type I repeat-containing protein [Ruminococcus sp.]
MKKTTKITACILAAVMTVGMAIPGVSAKAIDEDIKPIEDSCAKTVITYTDGTQRSLNGVVDSEQLENTSVVDRIASYEVFYDNNSIFEVQLNDIVSNNSSAVGSSQKLNGYYAITFNVSGNREGFLTGLTAKRVMTIENAMIAACDSGEDFEVEDIGIMDTEKTGIEGVDSNLCWAAATSNVLAYTGWADATGLGDEDDVFDLFSEKFNDDGSWSHCGFNWFFNGILPYGPDTIAAQAEANSGAYMTDYAYDNVAKTYDLLSGSSNRIDAAKTILNDLKNGRGIVLCGGLTLGAPVFFGAHAITCWGGLVNNNYGENEEEHYEMLFFADSDSDLTNLENRRSAPNKIHPLILSAYPDLDESFSSNSWYCENYYGLYLSEFTSVAPYPADGLAETSVKATKDMKNTTDFSVSGAFISPFQGVEINYMPISSSNDIYAAPIFINHSVNPYSGPVNYKITITNGSGKVVRKITAEENIKLDGYSVPTVGSYHRFDKLAAGNYTLNVQVNYTKAVKEAYYTNNTYSREFTIGKTSAEIAGASLNTGTQNKGLNVMGQKLVCNELIYENIPSKIKKSIVDCCYYVSEWDMETDTWSDWELADVSGKYPEEENPEIFLPASSKKVERLLTVFACDKLGFKYFISEPFMGGTVSKYLNLFKSSKGLSITQEQTGTSYSGPFVDTDFHVTVDGFSSWLGNDSQGFFNYNNNPFNYARETDLLVSYFDDETNSWTDWVWHEEGGIDWDTLPLSGDIKLCAGYSQAKLQFSYRAFGGKNFVVETEPFTIHSPKVTVSKSANSTKELSEVYSKKPQLAEGEKIVAVIKNVSDSFIGTVTGKCYLVAEDKYGNSYQLTKKVSYSVPEGKYIHKTFTSFNYPDLTYLPANRTYTVRLVVEGALYNETNNLGKFKTSKSYTKADVNADKQVDVSDVTLMQKNIAKLETFSKIQSSFADLNGDGSVDVIDVTYAQKYIAGIVDKPYV